MKRIKISPQEFDKALKISKERIKSAEVLIEEGLYRDAVSRSYYAVFEIVSALLAHKGEVAKTHSGLISLFGKHYIKTRLISLKYGQWFSHLLEERQRADYERLVDFKRKDAEKALSEAKDFFKATQKVFPKF